MNNNNIINKQQILAGSRDSLIPTECTSTPAQTSLSTSTKYMSPNHDVTGYLGGERATSISCKSVRKHKLKKPKDKPKRPLSAYNLFFKQERQTILASGQVDNCDTSELGNNKCTNDSNLIAASKSRLKKKSRNKIYLPHHKISFENLAKVIAKRWKNLDKDEINKFQSMADEDFCRYKQQMSEYNENEAKKKIRAEELITRQKVQLEARRIQKAQNLEHKLQIARLQLALRQLHQEHQHVLGQLLEVSSPRIDQATIINNRMNLYPGETNLPSLVPNASNTLLSSGIPVVFPFCNMTLPDNMDLFGHTQGIANVTAHPIQVPTTSRSSQIALSDNLADTEENEDDPNSLVDCLYRLQR